LFKTSVRSTQKFEVVYSQYIVVTEKSASDVKWLASLTTKPQTTGYCGFAPR